MWKFRLGYFRKIMRKEGGKRNEKRVLNERRYFWGVLKYNLISRW